MLVSLNILNRTFFLSKEFTAPGVIKIMAVISSLSPIHPVIDQLNNLGIVSLLMLPLFGIPFLTMFVDRRRYGLFVKSLRHSSFPRHIHRKPYPTGCLHGANSQPSLNIPFVLCFCFLRLRVCLSAEIRCYKSFN